MNEIAIALAGIVGCLLAAGALTRAATEIVLRVLGAA